MGGRSEEAEWSELPLFAPVGTEIPNDTTSEDAAAIGALSHLLYDEDTPEEASELLREQGNRSFKIGKHGYKRAIAKYTDAIAASAGTDVAGAAYLNRATAESRLGNYGRALRDAKAALQLTPNLTKAHYRAAMCALELRRSAEALSHCTTGEACASDEEKGAFASIRTRAERALKHEETRRRSVTVRDDARAEMLRARGVKMGRPLFAQQREYTRTQAYWNETWSWPVLVVYLGDERGVERSDYLADVEEEASVGDILDTVLAERPAWDDHGWYDDASKVEIRFRRDWTTVLKNTEADDDDADDDDAEMRKEDEGGEWVTVAKKTKLRELVGWDSYITPLFPVLFAIPHGWRG